MNVDESNPADAPIAQPDPHRFADGAAPSAGYTALPQDTTETIVIVSTNEELTHAEMGAFDGDD